MGALTFSVPAFELRPGDFVQGQGIVDVIEVKGALVVAIIATRLQLLDREQGMIVHLEDDGRDM